MTAEEAKKIINEISDEIERDQISLKLKNYYIDDLAKELEITKKALEMVCQEYGDKEEKSQAMIDAMPYWYKELAKECLLKEGEKE